MSVYPLAGLTLTIDRQEKDPARIRHIETFFEERGGDVEHKTLGVCDYLIEGKFRGVQVKVLIEYKRIDDLLANWKLLQTRFAEAIQQAPDIALFIEGPVKIHKHLGIDLVSRDGNHFIVRFTGSTRPYVINPFTPDDTGELLPYTTYQSKLAQWQEVNIQVRQFDEMSMFGESLFNLLGHLVPTTKHPYLELQKTDYRRERFLSYQTIPRIGADTAIKLAEEKACHWVNNKQELIATVKPAKAKYLLEFLGGE